MKELHFSDIKCVLLDIEGTVCPISFVVDTLFPYALEALPEVAKSKWDDEEFKKYRDAFPPDARNSPEQLQAHVEDLTKRNVKIAYFKDLQGYLWEEGYKSGVLSTPLFQDVTPKLKEWKDAGVQFAIYSSGSVSAQKLFFGHVKSIQQEPGGQKRSRDEDEEDEENDAEQPEKKRLATGEAATGEAARGDTATAESATGETTEEEDNNEPADSKVESTRDAVDEADATKEVAYDAAVEANGTSESAPLETEDLQPLISDWFDTTNAGPKIASQSYEKIAEAMKYPIKSILFLSDNVKEIDAATSAGMQVALVDRPGNAEVSEDDRKRLSIVKTFDEIVVDHTTPSATQEDDS